MLGVKVAKVSQTDGRRSRGRHYVKCADGHKRMVLEPNPTVPYLIDDIRDHGYPICCIIHFRTVNPVWRATLSEFNNHDLGDRILCPDCVISIVVGTGAE